MISHEHRCIFVHIPKTAGNSINRVFGIGWENHKDLQRYHDELPAATFGDYFKFAIVRNPWDRLLSDYNYQLKKSRAPASKLFVFAADGSKRSFAAWAETALSAPGTYDADAWGGSVSPHIHRWSPQLDWMSVEGEPRTDYVARLERLPEDFRRVCRHVGLPPVRLPHRNRRLHWHYSHYYDRATRDLVAAYYARDIAQFDYEFERAFFRVAVRWPAAPQRAETDDQHDSSDPTAAHTIAPGRCTVSFATARPPDRRRIWQRHPILAAAASVLMFAGLAATTFLASTAEAGEGIPPSAFRRALARASAPVPRDPAQSFFIEARRFSRTLSDLKLRLEIVPAPAAGAMLTLTSDTEVPVRNYRPAAVAPVASSSSSGPAPRWWIRRNRNLPDD